jgi:hypothetical protein
MKGASLTPFILPRTVDREVLTLVDERLDRGDLVAYINHVVFGLNTK